MYLVGFNMIKPLATPLVSNAFKVKVKEWAQRSHVLNICPLHNLFENIYSKTWVKRPLSKRSKNCFQGRLSLNAGQKYCRMLPLEHSAILSTYINIPVFIKNFVLSFIWVAVYTGFTVYSCSLKFIETMCTLLQGKGYSVRSKATS